jgi:hypothetical protein
MILCLLDEYFYIGESPIIQILFKWCQLKRHIRKKINLSLEGIPQLNNMDLTILYEINTMYYILSLKLYNAKHDGGSEW